MNHHDNRLDESLLPLATREPADANEKDTPAPSVFKAVEALTKGIEIPLPQGRSFKDKYGEDRSRVRVRWWDRDARTYPHAAILDKTICQSLPDLPIPEHACIADVTNKPTFFGHYWLTGVPARLGAATACVDYSIANNGRLVAYRWSGESELDDRNFHWVGP